MTKNHKVYYQRMAKSMYIVSPNGDRPECYRHYGRLTNV